MLRRQLYDAISALAGLFYMRYLVDGIIGNDGDAFDVQYRIMIFGLLSSDSISQKVGKHMCISHFLNWQPELQSKYNLCALVWIIELFHVFSFHVSACKTSLYPKTNPSSTILVAIHVSLTCPAPGFDTT